ncbi:hypothetical protein ACNOYE_05185 [Nannocystaceae bacterium ST9]
MTRRLAPGLALAFVLMAGCKDPPPPTREAAPAPAPDEPAIGQAPEFAEQTLSAAGIAIAVPREWKVLPEADPEFALAFDPTHKQTSACWIERRRQGLGALPAGFRAIDEGPSQRGYMRGVIRGIVQETPAPDGSTRVVHCRARRSDTKLWAKVIVPVLASQREAEPVEPGEPIASAGDRAIVGLCSAGPIVPGYVCALRADGAVYCGPTDAALDRVATPPAVEIGCRGQIACARAGTGEVACWSAGEPAQPQPSFGKARALADACVVDERGEVQCLVASDREAGRHELIASPLRAFDDPSLAITGARVLMAGSSSEQGCVLADAGVVCWDERGDLPVRFAAPPIASDEATGRREQAPESIDARDDLDDLDELRRVGDRLCVRAKGSAWRCSERSGETHELIGCGERPCGCSLLGGNQISCEDQPEPRFDALPQGRITDVVGVADPCAARVDGSVVCRKPGSIELAPIELREAPAPAQK